MFAVMASLVKSLARTPISFVALMHATVQLRAVKW